MTFPTEWFLPPTWSHVTWRDLHRKTLRFDSLLPASTCSPCESRDPTGGRGRKSSQGEKIKEKKNRPRQKTRTELVQRFPQIWTDYWSYRGRETSTDRSDSWHRKWLWWRSVFMQVWIMTGADSESQLGDRLINWLEGVAWVSVLILSHVQTTPESAGVVTDIWTITLYMQISGQWVETCWPHFTLKAQGLRFGCYSAETETFV